MKLPIKVLQSSLQLWLSSLMSNPLKSRSTVKTRIKEQVFLDFRLILFLFTGCFLEKQLQSVLNVFLNLFEQLNIAQDYRNKTSTQQIKKVFKFKGNFVTYYYGKTERVKCQCLASFKNDNQSSLGVKL